MKKKPEPVELTRRQQSALAKKIICNVLDVPAKDVSVKYGRGTAHSWLYISTDAPMTGEQRDEIERQIVENYLVGSYWPDWGPASADGHREANIAWMAADGCRCR